MTNSKCIEVLVSIDDNKLSEHINNLLDDNIVFVLGINEIIIFDYIPTKERFELEYAALCHLSQLSYKYLVSNPSLTREERISTPNSVIIGVSRKAFMSFQCMYLGIIETKRSKLYRKDLENNTIIKVLVANPSLGVLNWSNDEQIDNMLKKSRWTSNIYSAYGLKSIHDRKNNIYIDCSNLKINSYFYLQSPEKWQ